MDSGHVDIVAVEESQQFSDFSADSVRVPLNQRLVDVGVKTGPGFTFVTSHLLAGKPLMSAGNGGKSASAPASVCLRRRTRITSGIASWAVSSDAITRIAAITSRRYHRMLLHV